MKFNNTYFILRHGEAMSNVKHLVSSWPETFENPLTPHGVEMIQESARKMHQILAGRQLDMIFASDLLRTRQTAQIMADALKVPLKFDTRLRELSFGDMNGGPITDLDVRFNNESERIKNQRYNMESYEDVLARMSDFLLDIDKQYQGKHILIVSHEGPLWILEGFMKEWTLEESFARIPRDERIHKGQIKELN